MRHIDALTICAWLLITCGTAPASESGSKSVISLQGEWGFRLDPNNEGIDQNWFTSDLPEKVRLPGSTDENKKGTLNTRKPKYDYLSRVYQYVGPAWYQRQIDIPAEWKGKRITLTLERCHWETRVWLDGRDIGMQDSLCVPHVHDLGVDLGPGRHRVTIRVDNSHKYEMGKYAHSTSEQTQSNWNGIIGRIELQATDHLRIDDLQIYPDVAGRKARVRAVIMNTTAGAVKGHLDFGIIDKQDGKQVLHAAVPFTSEDPWFIVESVLSVGDKLKPWDEFSPVCYTLKASLATDSGTQLNPEFVSHDRGVTFGMRDLGIHNGKQFTLNGRKIFLRGTLECCIFPKTGYPPTDIESWQRIFGIAQSYGLNHIRFHSWCPPEAAFAAADQAGFLLHVEAPQWVFNVGQDGPRDRFIEQEVKRILTAYGNHPSFGMLCMGNELNGDTSFLQKLVKMGQQLDSRHFYTPATAWSFGENDEYDVGVVRGLHGPGTDFDFRNVDAKSRVPIISHEIGQWAVYPNLMEIPKYSGTLRARNFELIRDDLAAKGMLGQAAAFTKLSGVLSVLLYKEEIEVLLRTPGHAGFQLLDLHDFPGQGTATIGTLDAFWDSKGLITPEAYRRFCGPTVPLLRMSKRVYTSDETFTARAEIAHFGPAAIENAEPVWSIRDELGREIASGAFESRTLPTGNLLPLGDIKMPLAKVTSPVKWIITVSLKGTDIANDWNIWVYPSSKEVAIPADVVVCKSLDDSAMSALDAGGKVLLLPTWDAVVKSLPGSFTPVFWSPIWFNRGANTMGIICDRRHPSLADFPTEEHTDWQWYDLLARSRAIVLDKAPAGFRPIVQVIDNFSRNHRLGNLIEARVGKGRLLACSIDVSSELDKRPEARQLLRSMLAYMASDAFQPVGALDRQTLRAIFRPAVDTTGLIQAPSSFDGAVLRIKAAVNMPPTEKFEDWTRKGDQVLVRQEGYDYTVAGKTWRNNATSLWVNWQELVVRVTCPKGFTGKFYVHFYDLNNEGRQAEVFFQGEPLYPLNQYGGDGVWLCVPVTAKDSASGELVVSVLPTNRNVTVTQIVLTK